MWPVHNPAMTAFSLRQTLLLLALLVPNLLCRGAEIIILDMDTLRHRPSEVTDKDKKKVLIGTVESVEGKFGKAVKFSFTETQAGFMTASPRGNAEWDKAKGFSFYVKGDGSTNFGGIEMIDANNFGLRYGYAFPLDSTEWRKIVVPWKDLIPELAGPLVGVSGGYAPSSFGNLWFGKWFYWRDYPAHSFCIDQIALEMDIPGAAIAPAKAGGLKRFAAKLREKKPVTIVTMGDSLSDKRHWANRPVLWSEELVKRIQSEFGCEVKLVNPAIGGTTLSQNLILMPLWARQAPKPDLVTVWFGFNDWDSGVRGARFQEYLTLTVDCIQRLTGGSADILFLTTNPAHGRWETMKEMEEATRKVARDTGVGLADIAAQFRLAGDADTALKRNYWAWDKVHLGAKGHELVAETVLQEIKRELVIGH